MNTTGEGATIEKQKKTGTPKVSKPGATRRDQDNAKILHGSGDATKADSQLSDAIPKRGATPEEWRKIGGERGAESINRGVARKTRKK